MPNAAVGTHTNNIARDRRGSQKEAIATKQLSFYVNATNGALKSSMLHV